MRQLRIMFLVFSFGLFGLIACDSSGNVVTGKVTFDGKPVSGTIYFTGKGNKEVMAPIMGDGSYEAKKVTAGPNTITIKGRPDIGVPKGDVKAPEVKDGGTMPKGTADQGVAPPDKYGTEAGGLTLDVKSGKQEHNITLQK